ncbi:hypothetical protein TSAR_009863, partial [Trichomalopsis sarcophagae]
MEFITGKWQVSLIRKTELKRDKPTYEEARGEKQKLLLSVKADTDLELNPFNNEKSKEKTFANELGKIMLERAELSGKPSEPRYKMLGSTVIHHPRKACKLTAEKRSTDKESVKRLEEVVVHWVEANQNRPRRPGSEHLHIMFLDACSDFERERLTLQKNLNILHRTGFEGPRPYILIFFINRNNTFDVQLFLKKMWITQFYLYVTIIEVSNQASCRKQLKTSLSTTQHNIFVHQYNPFNDSYEAVPLFENRKLFNPKLRNLHGYILRASHSETHFGIIPYDRISGKRYIRRQIFSLAFSNSEFMLMKTIAQTLNYTINVTLVVSDENSKLNMHNALNLNKLDLSTNSIPSLTSGGIFGLPHFRETTHMLIKQYGYNTLQFPWHLVLYIIIILIIIIITRYSLFLLGSESHFSSLYNIAMIVIGISTPVKPTKLIEQILYVFLITISVFFSAEVMEYMFNIKFNTKQYFVFDTLQDVVDLGIRITIDTRFYIILKYGEKEEMLKILNVTVVPYEQECVDMMAKDDAEVMEYMFNIKFNTKQYFVYDTLQDVVDAGIRITVDNHFYRILKNGEGKVMRKILNVTVVPYEQECVEMMAKDDGKINACYSDCIMVDELIRNYSKPQDGWIISSVRENLFTHVPRFLVAKHSPYENEFSRIVQRLLESGIPMIWLAENLRNFALKNKEKIAPLNYTFLYHEYINKNQITDSTNNEQRLKVKLIYVLLVGFGLATFMFVIEVIIKEIQILRLLAVSPRPFANPFFFFFLDSIFYSNVGITIVKQLAILLQA